MRFLFLCALILGVSLFALQIRSQKSFQEGWRNPELWLESAVKHYGDPANERSPASVLRVYATSGLCRGLPRLAVKTAPGFCVGQIDSGENLTMPRFPLELPNGDILLSDMGSWDPGAGKIHLYKKSAVGFERKILFSRDSFPPNSDKRAIADRPNHLAIGPDKKVYVAAASAILRFDPANPMGSLEVVIKNLPADGLHSLKTIAFDGKGRVFVGVGSVTNVCQKFGRQGQWAKFCPESEELSSGRAQVRAYQFLPNGTIDAKFRIFAKGLRNSVALTWDPYRGRLIQLENGRDQINKYNNTLSDETLPHEEVNVLEEGKHYGWPYCFDNGKPNPEWSYINCSNYSNPHLLLPAHAAPVSAFFHRGGSNFPAWYQKRLIASFHGYREKGHRIVTFLMDEIGRPTDVPLSLVYGWQTADKKPGSPAGISQTQDGSILIAEDTNRKLLVLAYDENQGNGIAVREIDGNSSEPGDQDNEELTRKMMLEETLRDPSSPVFARFQHQVLDKHCVQCHGGANAPGIQFKSYDYIGNEKRILEEGLTSDLLARISQDPNFPPMPPAGFSSEEEQAEAVRLFKEWSAGVR